MPNDEFPSCPSTRVTDESVLRRIYISSLFEKLSDCPSKGCRVFFATLHRLLFTLKRENSVRKISSGKFPRDKRNTILFCACGSSAWQPPLPHHHLPQHSNPLLSTPRSVWTNGRLHKHNIGSLHKKPRTIAPFFSIEYLTSGQWKFFNLII